MAQASYRNKHIRRIRKRPGARRARIKVQKRRLVALGVPETTIEKLTTRDILDLLKRPCETKKQFADSSGK